MSSIQVILLVAAYFGLLFGFSRLVAKGSNNASFFTGNRNSPWYVVAFGMVGASLSGVTFLSVPGWVPTNQFAYVQMVLGYLAGYAIISFVLLPLYYRLNLQSIYTYFEHRFNAHAKMSGSLLFLVSRVIGAAFRLFLVASVFQYVIFDRVDMEVPFWVTIVITIALIWAYTYKSGIEAVVWTDTLQTAFMLLGAGVAVWLIADASHGSAGNAVDWLVSSDMSQVFYFGDWKSSQHFIKQFLSGMFITVVMTGMDQDMMQKNLTCRNLKDAQKNMLSLGVILIPVNILFLSLGALLAHYWTGLGGTLPEAADHLFPLVALEGGLGVLLAIMFLLGLIAAAYSSADSALTSLTTSFCVDILNIEKMDEKQQVFTRRMVHIVMSVILVGVILLFQDNESVIKQLFTWAGFTYGPLLGMFAFGLLTKRSLPKGWLIALPIVVAPVLTYILKVNSAEWFAGYQFSFEYLPINGLLTFVLLWVISHYPDGGKSEVSQLDG